MKKYLIDLDELEMGMEGVKAVYNTLLHGDEVDIGEAVMCISMLAQGLQKYYFDGDEDDVILDKHMGK